MQRQTVAVHHTIVVTDIENFTDPGRTNLDQLAIRDELYRIIEGSVSAAGVDWQACNVEDRGDGVFILIPSDVPKALLATKVVGQLAKRLARYNASCLARLRIRLRVAMHAGEVHYDRHGVTGCAINHAFRLIASPAVKAALRTSTGQLAVIVSAWFYDEVVRHFPAAEPSSYRRVTAAKIPAWIRSRWSRLTQ
jgi:hypothetical protein